MVFQMLAFKKFPKAEPFEPETVLSSPDSPELDEPDPDEKMLSPGPVRMSI